MVFGEEVPIKFKTEIEKSDLSYIKVECTSISGNTVKEEVPKFSGEESAEHYLLRVPPGASLG